MSTSETGTRWRTQIPADIDKPDPIIAGLSARQLLLLAPLVLAAWAAVGLLRPYLPLWALGLALAPLVGAGVAVVAGRRDGMSLDALAWAGVRWLRAPKRRVGAPGGIRPLPAWAPTAPRQPALAPLRLPARAIGDDGTLDLGDRQAVMVECSTLNLALASTGEQDAAVGAFAGILHTLTEPAQILVRARRHDLTPLIHLLQERAPALAHPDLEQAALDHAAWLAELQAGRDLLQRHLLLVLTTTAAGGLRERAEDVVTQLAALGLRARVCDGEAAWAYLHDSLHPATDPAEPAAPESTATEEEER
ncbi:PrgI family protein [Streptomonospora wellingtoniae]|uniref:PrgI family protein n=1 Tax=Streptomonospora wellingtoniae TaxID=3075544 RepID=A0ABU2KYH7_9ACTN|nr:PrgI family protein [Streptomonospora sp. DSM 45055]MDT0304320.1 PrgI family protein [Streptomonospora sp. DSM 45055]